MTPSRSGPADRPPVPDPSRPLAAAVAVVAGATRGAGRGVARGLGEAGATVYCTGRSVRGSPSAYGRPECIEDTAVLVDQAGGRGIPVRIDHREEAQVAELFARVKAESGRLDVLVNCVAGEDPTFDWSAGKPFWKADLDQGAGLVRQAIFSHVLTAKHAAPLMIANHRGLVVEVTDGNTISYRGFLLYDLIKTTLIRLAYIYAEDLRRHRVTAVAISPGYLRSESMLERYGVTEANWRDGAKKDPFFLNSETPLLLGRTVAALAADPRVARFSGRPLATWELAAEYDLTDADGRRPDLVAEFRKLPMAKKGAFRQAGERHVEWLQHLLQTQRSWMA
jgi:NAD(P)-dependent dehydrogenase (short-subunit alcohol dehydrogenase family)